MRLGKKRFFEIMKGIYIGMIFILIVAPHNHCGSHSRATIVFSMHGALVCAFAALGRGCQNLDPQN